MQPNDLRNQTAANLAYKNLHVHSRVNVGERPSIVTNVDLGARHHRYGNTLVTATNHDRPLPVIDRIDHADNRAGRLLRRAR